MNRRQFLKTLGVATTALQVSPTFLTAGTNHNARPNIIFILADDLGWSDIGCYGSEIETPNLDRLARNGVRFTQMHNTAKCFPSRACLLTGLYAQQCGMDKEPGSFRNAVTLGDVLRSAGYRTLASGKHHSTDNLFDQGFDRYYGLRDGCCNYFNPGYPREGEPVPARKGEKYRVWCIDNQVISPFTPEDRNFYTTDAFTDKAIEYLQHYRDEHKPFFLYLAYTAPHDPLQAWPADIQKYETRYLDGWAVLRQERYQRQQALGLIDASMPLSAPTYADWEQLTEAQKKIEARKMAVYAAMIDRMDQNIGRLLTKLDELGLTATTLIFFASDNGASAEISKPLISSGAIGSITAFTSLGGDWANACNTPFRNYKNSSHEGGICTPMIAHWPQGIKNPGRLSDSPAHFIDIMATLIDLTGAKYPRRWCGQTIPDYEGQSLVPILRNQSFARTKPLFWQWWHGRAVLNDHWKFVAWREQEELFDLRFDKTETHDLASQHPERLAELKTMHEQWLQRCTMME